MNASFITWGGVIHVIAFWLLSIYKRHDKKIVHHKIADVIRSWHKPYKRIGHACRFLELYYKHCSL